MPDGDVGEPDVDASALDVDAALNVDAAALVFGAPPCGDMTGLDPTSPWPMAGYCPTRQNQSALAPALASARIVGRFTLPASSSFIGGAALDANGVAYLLWYGPGDGGLRTFLSAIGNQQEAWRADVTDPAGFGHTGEALTAPVLAANGDVYVAVGSSLFAVTRTGSRRWTRQLGARVLAPLVLGDGTIVVTAGNVRALSSAGSDLWTYGTDAGAGFASSVTASATGLLFAVSRPDANGNASLHSFTTTATTQWIRPVRGSAAKVPLVDPKGRIVVLSQTGLTVFASDGNVLLDKATGVNDGSFPFGASSPPRVWFSDWGQSPQTLDVDTGNTQPFPVTGLASSFAATREGNLIFATKSNLRGSALHCLEPDGKVRWDVAMDPSGLDPLPPAIAANGTIYVPHADTLYIVGR